MLLGEVMKCWGWLEWVLGARGMAREHLHRTQQRPPASQHCTVHMDVRGGGKVAGYLITFLCHTYTACPVLPTLL